MNENVDSLQSILRPKSIAVIGASAKRGTIGGEIFHNLITNGFTGVVYPVNPNSNVVQAVKSYKSILKIPEPIDLAILVVPPKYILKVMDECVEKGIKSAVVITAGFKEVGKEGQNMEKLLVAKARANNIRIVGPNCLGVLNTDPEILLDATFAPTFPRKGGVSFMSQSGGLGVAILDKCQDLGLGISTFISVGNKADVSGNDLLEYWENDPLTDVILLYLESFGNPRKFTPIARRVSKKKPILVVKGGRSVSGRRAASSHTGSLAGVDVAAGALFRQAGVIRTDTLVELFNTAMVLVNQPLPQGRRVAILTNAGGPGILAADACEHYGLELPLLLPETVQKLKDILPQEASTRNPVDMVASATAELFQKAGKILLEADEIDILMVIFVPPIITRPDEVANAIALAREGTGKPVISCLMGAHGVLKGQRSLQKNKIPSFSFPESAANALGHVADYADWVNRPEGIIKQFKGIQKEKARKIIEKRISQNNDGWLHAEECRNLLEVYGIKPASIGFAKTAKEAGKMAREIGFPVAVKLASDTITHKSDVGGVRLNLVSESQVIDAFYAIEGHLRNVGLEDQMAGVNVQQMIPEGVEAIVGVTIDADFGPLIMFGLGGIYVELFKDVTFRLHPLSTQDAEEMIRGVKCYKLLEGYRQAPPADIDAIKDVLLRVSSMLTDIPEIQEIDFNPVKVLPPGEGCVVVDSRIRVRPVTPNKIH